MKIRMVSGFFVLLVSLNLRAQEQSTPPPQMSLPPLSSSTVETRISSEIAAANLTQKTPPEYPEKALDAQIEGNVVLDVLIGKNGKVKKIQVVSGNPVLSHAAVGAVRHWRYEPFGQQGQPVETRTQITVSFVLTKNPITCPGEPADLYAFLPDTKSKPVGSGNTAENLHQQPVSRVGDHVKPPRPVYSPDPEYSDTARRAKRQATGVLQVIVTPEGRVAVVRMERIMGYGLDQEAIRSVCQWKFNPALKDGQPVAVQISVEISFRLY